METVLAVAEILCEIAVTDANLRMISSGKHSVAFYLQIFVFLGAPGRLFLKCILFRDWEKIIKPYRNNDPSILIHHQFMLAGLLSLDKMDEYALCMYTCMMFCITIKLYINMFTTPWFPVVKPRPTTQPGTCITKKPCNVCYAITSPMTRCTNETVPHYTCVACLTRWERLNPYDTRRCFECREEGFI